MLLRLGFLTSFGSFNPRYPTEGDLPFQKLHKKKVGVFLPHHVARDGRAQRGDLHVVWNSHKKQWREQHWQAGTYHLKRRGSLVFVQIDHRLPVNMKIEILLQIKGWDPNPDEALSAFLALDAAEDP